MDEGVPLIETSCTCRHRHQYFSEWYSYLQQWWCANTVAPCTYVCTYFMYCFWWLIDLQLVSGCLVTKFCWGSNSARAATSGRISQTSTSTIAPPAMSPSALGSLSKVLADTMCILMHVYHDVICYCSPTHWSNSSHTYVDYPSPSNDYTNRAHFSLPQPLHLRVTLKDQMGHSVSVRFEQVKNM